MTINRTTDLDHLPTMLTVEEFLSFVPIPRSTTYGLLKKRTLASVKVGRRILIPRSGLVGLFTPKGEHESA